MYNAAPAEIWIRPVMYNATMIKLFLSLLVILQIGVAADLRLGIIGTDTSHVIAFTKAFNGPAGPGHVDGARVVAAFKGGSPDVKASYTRVDKFAAQLKNDWNVEFVDRITDLCPKVDAILIESVEGRVHLEQAKQAFACGKPMFIDKPLASTLRDAEAIEKAAKKAGIKWFSASSLRWSGPTAELKGQAAKATGIIIWGPGPVEEHHYLDLAWYGIHSVAGLYELMGPGCVEVTRMSSKNLDVVTGRWKDGRLGTVVTGRPYSGYGGVVILPEGAVQSSPKPKHSYLPLLRKMITFFKTGQAPVPNAETIEMFAFMDAAQRSKEQGGKPVKLR